MHLEHSKLEPFEPVLRSVLAAAFTTGLERLRSDGFRLNDIRDNERARNRFMRACHYGYDKAQQRIGERSDPVREND